MKKERRINEEWKINKLEIQENIWTNCQKELFTMVNGGKCKYEWWEKKEKCGNADNYNI